ncbi:Mitochondrial RNA pseudouridine synthase rpusd4 [Mortierella sp. AD031]|nr:Mitochondrial RNA pseudouridine synthase rpusd4 [Mortierella sp. AD031]KAG0202717.1 Mitochondrial RNA pseudouridine synthase rpusd4 [Mortierella sp. NVP41]
MDLLPLKEWVVYKDERIIVLNKPSGVPVQGGTGYLAIVESGKPIKEIYSNGATIRDDGSFRLQGDMSLITNEKAQAIQMVPNDTVSDPLVTKSVWPSTTDVVIAAQSYHSGVYWTLLHLYPRTGRKHQLRVHCAQLLNAPILGDFKYAGAGTRADTKGAPRIYLHMAELELKGWFTTSELQGTRIQEGANHRID